MTLPANGKPINVDPNDVIARVETRDANELAGIVDPKARLERARTMPEPLARESALSPRNRTVLADATLYQVIRHTIEFAGTAGNGPGKRYDVTGDHVFVDELNSGAACYIKLGPDSNPWIRLRKGATYRRQFSRITIKTADAAGFQFTSAAQDIVLIVSTGPCVEDANGIDGVGGVIAADDGTGAAIVATTTPTDIFQVIDGALTGLLTAGKNGGVLLVKNTDPVNTLYVQQRGHPGLTGFPLSPGETLSLKLGARVSSAARFIAVYCKAGTCAYAFLVSPLEEDMWDVNAAQGGGLNS